MKKIIFIFSMILVAMLIVTSWASLQESVFEGGKKIISEPWGIATLFDTYFAFLTFFVWLCYKEHGPFIKIVWFVLIVLLGNIAMSVYVLMEVYRLRKAFTLEKLISEKKPA